MRLLATAAAALALASGASSFAQAVSWNRTLNGAGGAAALLGDGHFITTSMAADGSGNAVVAGAASNGTNEDMLVAKLDAASGAVAWQKTFAGSGNGDDFATSVAIDSAGNAIVVGVAANATRDIQAIKYAAADGSVLWQRTLDSGRDEAAYFVALDGAGNAVVGSEAVNAAGNRDVRVTKLAGTGGATLWDKTFDGGADDFISGLVVDSSGDAVALVLTVNAAGNDDIRVIKYAGATGAVAWQRAYDGGSDDDGYGMALDASKNVFVAGTTRTAANRDLVALKLDAATGSIAWTKTWDGGGDDFGQSIAVDGAGDAYVTGQSASGAGHFVFQTLKLSGASGALVWQRAYDGGTNDYAYQVTLDGAGHAVVTGGTTVAGQLDWMAIAYGMADGAVLYQHSYAGSAGQSDQAVESVPVAGGILVAGTVAEAGSQPGVRIEKLLTPTAGAAASGVSQVIAHFYQAILRRAPDAAGAAYWQGQAAVMASLGASPDETWNAMAKAFLFSAEYASLGRDDAGFVTDLYNAFFNRPPDAGGLAYWTGLIGGGMPRDVVLATFMFSPEFATYLQGIVGNTAARAEVSTVMDFYRGLLSRLPDSSGFSFWVQQFRAAQCQGAGAVYAQVAAISGSFADGSEYASRNRTNAQYVGDLYNAFLRRGGDAAGVQFWIGQLDSGAQTRDALRAAFIATPEFTSRVNAIVTQGCVA